MSGYFSVYFAWVTLLAVGVWTRTAPTLAVGHRHFYVWHPENVCMAHPEMAHYWRRLRRGTALGVLMGGYGLGLLLLLLF